MRVRLHLVGALVLAPVGAAACAAGVAGSPAVSGGTATTVDLRQVEREILSELVAARTSPASYASRIEALLPHFDGRVLRRPGEVAIATQEGAAAVREAAAALRATPRLAPVTLAAGMARAARDHATDQGRRGTTGHQGSDGSTAGDRVNRYGRWTGRLTESISYGPVTGADVVQGLIIDDGVPGRGHRRNLLDGEVSVAGIGCAIHATYRVTCVIELAGGYEPR
jgi:uncharacterized protein YkwD